MNAINNARYALNQKYHDGEHEGKILEILSEEFSIHDKKYVRITFFDRGMGIASDILDKVMDPFFSTKPSGIGTGLGLSISHGIISDHGGRVRIESNKGEFTKVIIDIPSRGKDESKDFISR